MITEVLVPTSSTIAKGQANISTEEGIKNVTVAYPGPGLDPYWLNFDLLSNHQWDANTLIDDSSL